MDGVGVGIVVVAIVASFMAVVELTSHGGEAEALSEASELETHLSWTNQGLRSSLHIYGLRARGHQCRFI